MASSISMRSSPSCKLSLARFPVRKRELNTKHIRNTAENTMSVIVEENWLVIKNLESFKLAPRRWFDCSMSVWVLSFSVMLRLKLSMSDCIRALTRLTVIASEMTWKRTIRAA